jgi:23S rRNA pseudouridine2605 synthase
MKRKTDNFSKFYNKKSNAAIKETFRQEKKAAKKERREAIERRFEERRQAQGQHQHPRPEVPAKKAPFDAAPPPGEQLPLNKYIAHGGICSRRDAADLIRQGKVTVNGKPVTEPGTKVLPTDMVKVNGKKVTMSRNFVYVLLNKPKDYITTMEDPQGRRTVLDLVRAATTERIFPVGRLDRNTSGVLLLTNDGDLAQKLAHPSHEIKKVYHVTLDKALTKADFDKIVGGVTLEDGLAHVDVLAYADPKDKTQVGLEIHSGRNRIVRRIFEHLGYDVRGLDRVMYAGLTKKNVQRGKWRLLTEKEIRILKYLNSSIKGSPARAKDWAANPAAATAPAAGAAATASAPTAPRASARPKPTGTTPKPTGRPTGTGATRKPASTGAARATRKPAPSNRPARPAARASGRPIKPTPRPRKPKSRPDEE